MLVKDLMSTAPVTASSETSFLKLWRLIFDKHISGIPIIDKQNELLGIISEEDIIEKLYPSYEDVFLDPTASRDFSEIEHNLSRAAKLKAIDFMNKEVFTTSEDTPIMKAAASMLINKVSCLPVIETQEDRKYLKGIICKHDIFNELFLANLGKVK